MSSPELGSTSKSPTSASQRRLQARLEAAISEYAQRYENGERFPPLGSENGLTATQIAIICSALLKAADIAPFELAMWDSWHS